jgi:hypothetical protein
MRKAHSIIIIPALTLIACLIVEAQDSPHESSRLSAQSTLRLVELVHTYRIQVPDDLALVGFFDGTTRQSSVPEYIFRGPHYRGIDVMVLPYKSEIDTYGLIPINEETGIFKLPFSINGSNPLAAYFKTAKGGYVYYGWSTGDTAYACTMNTPCPHRTERSSRYQTIYTFVVFDKANDCIIEFTGYSYGPSKNVTEFQGDGKVLHDIIVPSLDLIQ